MSPEFDDMFDVTLDGQWWSSRPDGLPGESCPNIDGPITRRKLRPSQIYQHEYSLNGSEDGEDMPLEIDSSGRDARSPSREAIGSQQIRR